MEPEGNVDKEMVVDPELQEHIDEIWKRPMFYYGCPCCFNECAEHDVRELVKNWNSRK